MISHLDCAFYAEAYNDIQRRVRNLRHLVHQSHADNASKPMSLGSHYIIDVAYCVYCTKLVVYIVSYSCMLTQLYIDLFGVTLR